MYIRIQAGSDLMYVPFMCFHEWMSPYACMCMCKRRFWNKWSQSCHGWRLFELIKMYSENRYLIVMIKVLFMSFWLSVILSLLVKKNILKLIQFWLQSCRNLYELCILRKFYAMTILRDLAMGIEEGKISIYKRQTILKTMNPLKGVFHSWQSRIRYAFILFNYYYETQRKGNDRVSSILFMPELAF